MLLFDKCEQRMLACAAVSNYGGPDLHKAKSWQQVALVQGSNLHHHAFQHPEAETGAIKQAYRRRWHRWHWQLSQAIADSKLYNLHADDHPKLLF